MRAVSLLLAVFFGWLDWNWSLALEPGSKETALHAYSPAVQLASLSSAAACRSTSSMSIDCFSPSLAGAKSALDEFLNVIRRKMKLGDFLWWPKQWTFDDIWSHRRAPTEQVRQYGILAGCGLTRHGLLMQVHYYGQTLVGRVGQLPINAPADMLALCDFLSEHLGESIGKIEDIEVDPDRF